MSVLATEFNNQVCVITGAGSGIGRALALQLSEAGAMLALSDIDEAALAETFELTGGAGSNTIITDKLDVADGEAVETYAGKVQQALGDAKHVFNVAGIARVGRFDESSMNAFDKVMDVNFGGVVKMSKAFLPQLVKTKGHLTNVSSVFGFIGNPGNASYCASKFAVRGFSETIGIELQEQGVKVHSVHPGGIDTNIVRNAEIDALPEGVESKDDLQKNFQEKAITSPEKAAETIINGINKNKKRILIGPDASLISIISRLFPSSYAKVIAKLFQRD